MKLTARNAAFVAVFAALLGLVFASYSTYDYAQQLDRQVHAVHCSFIPGAPVTLDAENACKAALFSPYSAIFRASWWGGVPISLFAMGAFGFFAGFGLYLATGGRTLSNRAYAFFAAAALTPVGASLVMFVVTLLHLHEFCKLCVGIYFSSFLLAGAAALAWRAHLREQQDLATAATVPADMPSAAPEGWGKAVLWLALLGGAALLPALIYVSSLPDYHSRITGCGKLAVASDPHNSLLKIPTAHPVRPVTLFEDPLCPTCKAFHERLVAEGIFDKLDVTLVMFPLDSECNWMLDRPLHAGACTMAKAVLCGNDKARAVLEWAYDNQEELRELGKQGGGALAGKIGERWGSDLAACVANKATGARLNQELHYAVSNHIPVSTPQMFLGDNRVCDEDTDLGLKYTLAQLAPEVLP